MDFKIPRHPQTPFKDQCLAQPAPDGFPAFGARAGFLRRIFWDSLQLPLPGWWLELTQNVGILVWLVFESVFYRVPWFGGCRFRTFWVEKSRCPLLSRISQPLHNVRGLLAQWCVATFGTRAMLTTPQAMRSGAALGVCLGWFQDSTEHTVLFGEDLVVEIRLIATLASLLETCSLCFQ